MGFTASYEYTVTRYKTCNWLLIKCKQTEEKEVQSDSSLDPDPPCSTGCMFLITSRYRRVWYTPRSELVLDYTIFVGLVVAS